MHPRLPSRRSYSPTRMSQTQPDEVDNPFEDAVIGVTVDQPIEIEPETTRFDTKTYGLIALLGCLAGMGPLAIDLYLPGFKAIATDLNSTVAHVQQTLAIYFIGLAAGQLFYGPAADRFGRKGPLYLGLGLFIVASAGCATAKTVDQLVAWRFVQALGGCAEMVIARAIVRDKFHARDAARVFSLLVLVMGMAPILGPIVGGWMLVAWGWRVLFWTLAVFGVGCLAAVALLLPETLPADRRVKQTLGDIVRTARMLLTDRSFIVHTAGAALGSAAMFAYIGGVPFVYMNLFGISETHFGYFFGANAAGLIAAAQVNGWLVRRVDPAKVLRGAMFVEASAGCFLLLAAFTGFGGFVAVLICLFCMVASLGFIFPNTTALAMAPHGRVAGNASAILGCFQFGVSGAGGFLVSAFHNGTAVPMAAVIAICATSALLINLLFAPRVTVE